MFYIVSTFYLFILVCDDLALVGSPLVCAKECLRNDKKKKKGKKGPSEGLCFQLQYLYFIGFNGVRHTGNPGGGNNNGREVDEPLQAEEAAREQDRSSVGH